MPLDNARKRKFLHPITLSFNRSLFIREDNFLSLPSFQPTLFQSYFWRFISYLHMHTMIYVPQSGDDTQTQASLLLVCLCTRPPYKHFGKLVFKLHITSHFLPQAMLWINYNFRWLPQRVRVRGGAAGWGHYSTSRKVAGSIPDGVIGIFHWHNPSGRTMVLELTQPLTEMSTRNTVFTRVIHAFNTIFKKLPV